MAGAREFDPAAFEGLTRAVVGIDGLWCPSCAAAVERTLAAMPGITGARVSYIAGSAALAWDRGTDLSAVARRVARLGYRLAPAEQDGMERRILAEMRRVGVRLALAIVFGMWTMVLSILLYLDPDGIASGETGRALAVAAGATALPVVTWAGGPILVAGWRTARAGVPGMDSLVGLGAVGAMAASLLSLATGGSAVWFDTAVMLVTLLTLGRLLEMSTLRQSARAIAALRSALPETARLVGADGQPREVLASAVSAGQLVRVAAGERMPLDGRLTGSGSRFDTSVLTGEAVPRTIGPGGAVEAGFVNLSCGVELEVSAEVGMRRIDRMGNDIAIALHDRPEVHRLADRLARVIVPMAIGLSLATLGIGLAAGLPAGAAGLRALSVLVIACPCAVSLAAPLSHLAATGAAAARGIHFRTQAASETLGTVRRVLFDKTGTLTEGRPVLRDVHLQPGLDRSRMLALAAAAEHEVAHPIAHALREAGGDSLVSARTTAERFDDGVRAEVDGDAVLVGSRGFLERHGIPAPQSDDAAGATSVHMALGNAWSATFVLGDRLRPDAAATIAELRQCGLVVELASGDAPQPCASIGRLVGLEPRRIHAGCTPEDKARLIRSSGVPTAFVGDGVNDALAIVAADVGIAAREASPATIALADVAIAGGGMSPVAEAIGISRRARTILRQNLVFSVAYNVLALGLAASGTVPPLAAAGAMAASSLMVVANTAQLRARPTAAR